MGTRYGLAVVSFRWLSLQKVLQGVVVAFEPLSLLLYGIKPRFDVARKRLDGLAGGGAVLEDLFDLVAEVVLSSTRMTVWDPKIERISRVYPMRTLTAPLESAPLSLDAPPMMLQ